MSDEGAGRRDPDSQDSRSAAQADPPPLRIHHLLVWMAATAVLISVSLWFDRTARNGPAIENKVVIASLTLCAITIAGALTFTLVGTYWRNNGYPFPSRPGEWLLCVLAYSAMAMTVAFIGIFIAFGIAHDLLAIYYPVAGLALLTYWVRMILQGRAHFADTGPWRWVFGSLMLLPLVYLTTTWPIVIFLACLLWASINDLQRKTARGWVHWLGVTLSIAMGCAGIGIIGSL
jgi:hypothetical protein